MRYRTEIHIDVLGTPYMPQGTHRSQLWLDVVIDIPERYAGFIIDPETYAKQTFTEMALDEAQLCDIRSGMLFNPNDDTDAEYIANVEKIPLAFDYGNLIVKLALNNYETEELQRFMRVQEKT